MVRNLVADHQAPVFEAQVIMNDLKFPHAIVVWIRSPVGAFPVLVSTTMSARSRFATAACMGIA